MEHLNPDFGGARATGYGVGPVLERFSDVSRIAVLRGGGLGDLIYALPAVVGALKAAYPEASVTLLGTPIHAELLSQIEGPLDETLILPFAEGVRPGAEDHARAGPVLRRNARQEIRPRRPASWRRALLESVPAPPRGTPHRGHQDP